VTESDSVRVCPRCGQPVGDVKYCSLCDESETGGISARKAIGARWTGLSNTVKRLVIAGAGVALVAAIVILATTRSGQTGNPNSQPTTSALSPVDLNKGTTFHLDNSLGFDGTQSFLMQSVATTLADRGLGLVQNFDYSCDYGADEWFCGADATNGGQWQWAISDDSQGNLAVQAVTICSAAGGCTPVT